jgi:hypothetical protein
VQCGNLDPQKMLQATKIGSPIGDALSLPTDTLVLHLYYLFLSKLAIFLLTCKKYHIFYPKVVVQRFDTKQISNLELHIRLVTHLLHSISSHLLRLWHKSCKCCNYLLLRLWHTRHYHNNIKIS